MQALYKIWDKLRIGRHTNGAGRGVSRTGLGTTDLNRLHYSFILIKTSRMPLGIYNMSGMGEFFIILRPVFKACHHTHIISSV